MIFVRVKHDREWWKLENGELVKNSRLEDPRWNWADYSYPAPVPHTSNPRAGDNNLRVTREWYEYISAINTPDAWMAATINNAGLINWASNKEWGQGKPVVPPPYPVVEGITSILNVHKALERKNGSTRIETFLIGDAPPDPRVVNPKTHPWKFVKFTSIDKNGNVGLAPKGKEFYFPLLAKGEAWITDDKLERLAEYPQEDNVSEQTVLDLSKWQGEIDARKMYDAGIRAVKLRLTIADYYEDPKWREYYYALKAVGMKVGGYVVVRPHISAQKHLDKLWDVVGDTEFDLPFTVDDEINTDFSGKVVPKSIVDSVVKGICEGIEKADGRVPEIYSNWNHITNNHGSSRDWMLNYSLHLAWYGSGVRVPDSRIPEPYLSAWKNGQIERPYVLWQHSDKGNGAMYGTSSSSLDLNKPWPGLDYDNLYVGSPPQPPQELTDKEKLDLLWSWYEENH